MRVTKIVLVLAAVIGHAGCQRPAPTPKEIDATVEPLTNEVVTPSNSEITAVDPKSLSPKIRQRSPEPLRQRIRETVARMQADAEPRQRRQALHRVANAVLQYQRQHGALPADSPNLSWRVALLPFLGEDRLSREFHPDEPWNSPHNTALVARMPKVLGDDPLGLTRCRLATDRAQSPVLVWESPDSDQTFWTQPAEPVSAATALPQRIALRDGTVCELDAKLSLEDGTAWLNGKSSLSDLPVWLRRFPTSIGVKPFADGAPEESSGPYRPALPVGTGGVLHMETRRLLRNPHVLAIVQNALTEPNPASSPTVLQSLLGPFGPSLSTGARWMKERGVDPLRLESQTVVVPAAIWTGPVVRAEAFAVVCRAPAAFDVSGLIAHEMETSVAYQYREQGASAGIIDPRRSFAWQFRDDTTALFGGQTLVASLSEAQEGDCPLTAKWAAADTAPVVLLLDCVPLQPWLEQQAVNGPSFLQEAWPALREARALVLTFDPDSSAWGTLTIDFREAAAAQSLHEIVSAQIEQQRLKARPETTGTVSVQEDWRAMLMQQLECTRDGARWRLTLSRPPHWEARLQQLITRAE